MVIMVRQFLSSAALLSLLSGLASAIHPLPPPEALAIPPRSFHTLAAVNSTTGNTTFQQYIDHDNPSLGTFSQRVWWNREFWNGPGSPVVFFTPGEIAADGYQGYLTNTTITGAYAQAIGGAVVMLEHRYWGQSSPYQNLTTKNLQYLNLKQSILDTTHFAKTFSFPFDPTNSSQADKAPWVFSGGSYSGALAAWTEQIAPGTFWAYHSSSAPVQAIWDYWQYFTPVQEGMPKNCSKDLSAVVDHIDSILTHGTPAQQHALKKKFGLEDLKYNSDFAAAIENGPWLWQSNSFTTNYSGFYQFCDYIEGVYANNTNGAYGQKPRVPGIEGVSVQTALEGYATWMKNQFIPGYCRDTYGYWGGLTETACFDLHNKSSPLFTDWSVSNTFNRQWNWFLCNEPFGYWQDGAPRNRPSIVSRLVDSKYWSDQCDLLFPPEDGFTYGYKKGKTPADINKWTKGWFLTNTTRLIWTNGQFDPWKTTSMSSEFRPGGPLKSRPEAPLQVIPGGFHCSDLRLRNADANAGVRNVVNNEIAQIKKWVSEWPGYKH